MQLSLRPCVDVLVLGAGLSGLRAARGALEANPRAAVMVVASRRGPAGSSFANSNNRLGMHAPMDDAAKEAFVDEALALAPPGQARKELVEVLAQQALPRLRELEALGVQFWRDSHGALQRHPSCFSPHSRNAVVFPSLGRVYVKMRRYATALGASMLAPMTATGLLHDAEGGRVLGALLEDDAGVPCAQPARATVLALGGSAPLFRHCQAGIGGTGMGHGLLLAASAAMCNTAYLQWMWATLEDRAFWPVWSLLDGQALAVNQAGDPVPIPEDVRAASQSRSHHCPYGHGLPDAALDHFLLDLADAQGVATIQTNDGMRRRVTLMAHATNGGAVIDAHARTTVPGLFAVGECATGMHGANRIGGAMVSACLAFGARAGAAAAREGAEPAPRALAEAAERALSSHHSDPLQREAVKSWLQDKLCGAAPKGVFEGEPGAALERVLHSRLAVATDAQARQLLRAAMTL